MSYTLLFTNTEVQNSKKQKKEGYNLGKYIIHFATQAGIVVNVNQVANLPSYPIEYVTQKNTYNEYTISN